MQRALSPSCSVTVEKDLLIRKAEVCAGGGVSQEKNVRYIDSFIRHRKSLSEQRLISSDLYLERAYIRTTNQVNTVYNHRTHHLCKEQQPKWQHLQVKHSLSAYWLSTKKHATTVASALPATLNYSLLPRRRKVNYKPNKEISSLYMLAEKIWTYYTIILLSEIYYFNQLQSSFILKM